MTINFEYTAKDKLRIQYKALAKKVIEEVLAHEGCPCEAEVSILVADEELIKELNKEYRNIPKTTDVLSFPAIDFIKPSDFKNIQNDRANFNMETGELVLGDIALNANKVLEQAISYGHSTRREYAFLIAHSMLHLLGYDHINDIERLKMEELQEEILGNLGIFR